MAERVRTGGGPSAEERLQQAVERLDHVGVSERKVGVRKSATLAEFDIPTLKYEIKSDHERRVSIRLLDTLPPDVAAEEVGFNAEYHGEDWEKAGGGRLAFTRELAPGERVVTVVGIQPDSPERLRDFMGIPDLAVEYAEPEPEADEGNEEPAGGPEQEGSDGDGSSPGRPSGTPSVGTASDTQDGTVPETLDLEDPSDDGTVGTPTRSRVNGSSATGSGSSSTAANAGGPTSNGHGGTSSSGSPNGDGKRTNGTGPSASRTGPDVTERINAIADGIKQLDETKVDTEALADLEARVEHLERRDATGGGAGAEELERVRRNAAHEDDLDAVREALETLRSEAAHKDDLRALRDTVENSDGSDDVTREVERLREEVTQLRDTRDRLVEMDARMKRLEAELGI